jgi:alkylation response protein AidB-like acyl-CoA dehydrogenase
MPMDMKLSPEQVKLRSAARELAEAEFAARAAEIDRTEAYPFDNVAALKAAGFMGYTIPTSYGGRGGSYFEAALVIEEMARVCGATGRITVEANIDAISAVM